MPENIYTQLKPKKFMQKFVVKALVPVHWFVCQTIYPERAFCFVFPMDDQTREAEVCKYMYSTSGDVLPYNVLV